MQEKNLFSVPYYPSTDINECEQAAISDIDICPNRFCMNTMGSFECGCPEGLILFNETCIFGTSLAVPLDKHPF